MDALNQNWPVLIFVSEDLRRDGDILMAVVKHYKQAVLFTSYYIQKDRCIVMTADIRKGGRSYLHHIIFIKTGRL